MSVEGSESLIDETPARQRVHLTNCDNAPTPADIDELVERERLAENGTSWKYLDYTRGTQLVSVYPLTSLLRHTLRRRWDGWLKVVIGDADIYNDHVNHMKTHPRTESKPTHDSISTAVRTTTLRKYDADYFHLSNYHLHDTIHMNISV